MAKGWTDGDYVNSQDLDELTGCSNMVFANATARDAFLVGDLTPAQGMAVTLLDEGVPCRRITVSGSSYWAPIPGTFLCEVDQATTHTLGAQNAVTQITNLSTVVGRNFRSWFNTATWRFQPTCPGYYELDGRISIASATGGDRVSWFALNGASLAAAVSGSIICHQLSGSSLPMSWPLRTTFVYLNGVGDYVTLMFSHNVSATLSTAITSPQGVSSFSAKYAGP